MNVDWRTAALCREVDPELMFPTKGQSAKPAKRICGRCRVRRACLTSALEFSDADDRFGIFGGTTPAERKRLRREAARPLAPVIPLGVPAVPDRERRAA